MSKHVNQGLTMVHTGTCFWAPCSPSHLAISPCCSPADYHPEFPDDTFNAHLFHKRPLCTNHTSVQTLCLHSVPTKEWKYISLAKGQFQKPVTHFCFWIWILGTAYDPFHWLKWRTIQTDRLFSWEHKPVTDHHLFSPSGCVFPLRRAITSSCGNLTYYPKGWFWHKYYPRKLHFP